jgi:hypothetical protein
MCNSHLPRFLHDATPPAVSLSEKKDKVESDSASIDAEATAPRADRHNPSDPTVLCRLRERSVPHARYDQ